MTSLETALASLEAHESLQFSHLADNIGTNITNNVSNIITSTIQSFNASDIVSGLLPIAFGGTGTSSAPTNGQILVGNASGGYDLMAGSAFLSSFGSGNGITSLGAQYSTAQGGAAQTLATSSDTNILLNITSASNTHTFTPVWTGTLAVGRGGTGASSFGQGWIYSAGGTGALAASSSPTVGYIVATSSLASIFPNASTTLLTVSKIFDSANSLGSNGSILQSNGSTASWTATSSLGVAISDTTGTLALTRGGTGLTSITSGSLLFASAANTLTTLASTSGAGRFLTLDYASGQPSWVATSSLGVNFTNVVGTAGVTQGGTGLTSVTSGDLLFASANNTLTSLASTSGAGRFLTLNYVNGRPAWTATSSLGVAISDTTGTLATTRGGTGLSSFTSGDLIFASAANTLTTLASTSGAGRFLTLNYASGQPAWTATSSLGVAISDTTGTLALTRGGTGLTSVTSGDLIFASAANTLTSLASTSGAGRFLTLDYVSGRPSWVATSSLGVAISDTVGTLAATKGGTGLTSFNSGDLIFASAANTLTALASTSGAGRFLTLDYTTGRPSWVATTSLGVAISDTTGTLAATRGGTGLSSFTSGDLIFASANNTLTALASTSGAGRFLTLDYTTGRPSWVATTSLGVNFTNVVGTAGVTQGGTGLTSVTSGDLLFASANNTLTSLASTSGAGRFLTLNYVTGRPAWTATSSLGVAFTDVVGTAGVTQGGTGLSSITSGSLLFASANNTLTALASTSGAGRFLMLNYASGQPAWTATSSLGVAFTDIVGTASVSQGGTGATAYGQGWIFSAGGTGALAASSSPTVGFIVATTTTATSYFGGNVGFGTTTPGNSAPFGFAGNVYFGGTGTSTVRANLDVLGTLHGKILYSGDLVFANDFRFTEAPLDGAPQGLYLQNQHGAGVLSVDEKGNLTVSGDICKQGAQCWDKSLSALTADLQTLASSNATSSKSLGDLSAQVQSLSLSLDAVSGALSSVASTTASSLEGSPSFMQSLANSVMALLQSAASWTVNEIHAGLAVFTTVRSDSVETQQLCIGQTCVTETQLKQLLQSQNVAAASPAVTGGSSSSTSSPSVGSTPAPTVSGPETSTSTATTPAGPADAPVSTSTEPVDALSPPVGSTDPIQTAPPAPDASVPDAATPAQ